MASYGGHALRTESELSLRLRARFTEASESKDHVFLLAVREGREEESVGIIEAGEVCPLDIFQPKSVLHVYSIYVEADCRRKGIGRRLLEAALEWGREQRGVEAELSVLAMNPARKLYESAGLEVSELEMRLAL
jgi:ribosomal protein S18 acetylase RimI-like enzyme